jgi:hypothetical protein
MHHLTVEIHSEKGIVKQFCCVNIIECTYIILGGIAYYTPKVYVYMGVYVHIQHTIVCVCVCVCV